MFFFFHLRVPLILHFFPHIFCFNVHSGTKTSVRAIGEASVLSAYLRTYEHMLIKRQQEGTLYACHIDIYDEKPTYI
jgi:hypothetical protein